jgi:hypothetical protein
VEIGNDQYEIRSLHDKCLDVSGGSADDGTPIVQHSRHGGPNQKFRLRDV